MDTQLTVVVVVVVAAKVKCHAEVPLAPATSARRIPRVVAHFLVKESLRKQPIVTDTPLLLQ